MHIREVIAGLKEGKAYIRYFGSGHETVQPLDNGRVEHIFAGHDYGGAAELDIGTLNNGRWVENGWSYLGGST